MSERPLPEPHDAAPGAAHGTPHEAAHDVESPRVPIGTLVFGSVAAVLGLLLLAGLLYGFVLDPAYVAVGLLVGAGALMIVGGLAAGRRSRR